MPSARVTEFQQVFAVKGSNEVTARVYSATHASETDRFYFHFHSCTCISHPEPSDLPHAAGWCRRSDFDSDHRGRERHPICGRISIEFPLATESVVQGLDTIE